MPHIYIFLQELDQLYNTGDLETYEQYWQTGLFNSAQET